MKNVLLGLLKTKRFAPYFWTQFLGAFNDNVYKNALIIIITFQVANLSSNTSDMLVNICMGLFILPFFLFSAIAGQLADKYEKAKLIRYIKLFEIVIMILASIGLYLINVSYLLAVLFLLGFQAALFGPVKYSILPQHLKQKELIAGNGLVESGTFIAILVGTIAGGVLISVSHYGWALVSILLLIASIFGYLFSRGIPRAKSYNPTLKIKWNPLSQSWMNIQYARKSRTVFLSILGNSWFWFYGSVFLAQLPSFTKHFLGGNEHIVTLLLVLFSVGIGLGSILCDRMSGHKIEIGLVPFGSIGLSLFAMTLYFLSQSAYSGEPMSFTTFILIPYHWLILANVIILGIFGGFYIVPLYALIQDRSDKSIRSRIISANNILNALFMVIAAIFAIIILKTGFNIPELFLITGLINALVAIYIYTLVPEFSMRFLVWIIVSILYKVKTVGLEKNIPEEGGAVVVCNHVSFIDVLIIMASIRRPIRFVMDYHIFKIPVFNFIFRTARAIPIASEKDNADIKAKAFDAIAKGLEHGELIGIFPEGAITRDGNIQQFKRGIEHIIGRTPVPVIPLALRGLWGSFFSRIYGKAMSRFPKRIRYKVELHAAAPVPAKEVLAGKLQTIVEDLRGDAR